MGKIIELADSVQVLKKIRRGHERVGVRKMSPVRKKISLAHFHIKALQNRINKPSFRAWFLGKSETV